jgi:hypothetical protein
MLFNREFIITLLFTWLVVSYPFKIILQEVDRANYPGLSVSRKVVLLLNGRPFRGVGANYFDAFARTLSPGSLNDTSYLKGFEYLMDRNIPFIRFSAGGYWPSDWDLYLNDKDRYFQNLDAFILAAEKYQVGLILSFFWHNSTIPDIVEEPIDQWGNLNSKTIDFMRQYVQEVVLDSYRITMAGVLFEFPNHVHDGHNYSKACVSDLEVYIRNND